MEMQIKRNSDALAVAKKIVNEGGITAFWKGNLMNLIRVTPHKVLNIMHNDVAPGKYAARLASRQIGFKLQVLVDDNTVYVRCNQIGSTFRLPIVFAAIEVSAVNTLQAVNFYSFYVYRTALSKTLAATQTSLGGLDRFLAGAMAGKPFPLCHAKFSCTPLYSSGLLMSRCFSINSIPFLPHSKMFCLNTPKLPQIC